MGWGGWGFIWGGELCGPIRLSDADRDLGPLVFNCLDGWIVILCFRFNSTVFWVL